MAANKDNITKRLVIDRPLTHAEGDANLQELINNIDDLAGHKADANPHSQYYKDGDDISGGTVTTSTGTNQSLPDALEARGAVFDTVADMDAATNLQVGQKVRTLGYNTVGDGGGNDYEIVAAGTDTDDGGSYIDLPGSGLQAKGLFPGGVVNVKQFGAVGDDSDATATFSACAAYTASLAVDGGDNKGPLIHIAGGRFTISSQIADKATWVIAPDGIINGQPVVSPTSENDTSYLTGRVVTYGGVDQSRVLRIGDPAFTVQTLTKKGHAGELSAYSPNASAGVLGASHTSGSLSETDQGTIGLLGVGVSDATGKTSWAGYYESFKAPAVAGNAFGMEVTSFNYGAVAPSNPYTAWGEGDDLTVNMYLTTGDTSALGTIWGSTSNDVTAAIAIAGKGGAQYGHGILVRDGAVSSGHAITLPLSYDMVWMNAGDRDTAYVRKDAQRLESETNAAVRHVRWQTGVGGVQQGAGLISSTVYATRDAGDVDYELCRWDVYQQSAFSAGEAGSRSDLIVHKDDGSEMRYQFLSLHLSPDDNQASCGSPARRWSEIYAVNGSINTSDRREKQQITTLSDAERAAAQQLKGMIRKFKWKHAVEEKDVGARWHFGVIAQDVEQIFTTHGLDATEYGLFCHGQWDAEYDADGSLILEAGERYGVRYEELLAFIISAM